jgi:hypothetical protein
MGDVKLTARETSRLLRSLDDSRRSLDEAHDQVITAMARRRIKRVTTRVRAGTKKTRGKRSS